jgi:hypothetical protein
MGTLTSPRDTLLNLIQDLVKAMDLSLRSLGKWFEGSTFHLQSSNSITGKGNFEGSTGPE